MNEKVFGLNMLANSQSGPPLVSYKCPKSGCSGYFQISHGWVEVDQTVCQTCGTIYRIVGDTESAATRTPTAEGE